MRRTTYARPAPVNLTGYDRLHLTDGSGIVLETRYAPLWWHVKGLSFTRTGYGGRIPMPYLVRIPGSPRWRRVYCAIWSNSGTCYVENRAARRPNGRPEWIVVSR